MGYDIFITRADRWEGSAEYPISLDEWQIASRAVATAGDDELVQVECCAEFAMTDELAGLGTFHEWWFPGESEYREAVAWIEAIESRAECPGAG